MFFVLCVCGLIAGGFAGLLGIGGGAITLSLLTLAEQWHLYAGTLAAATGLASTQSLFAAGSAAVVHHKQGRVCWPMVLLLLGVAMVGGYAGGAITAIVPETVLRGLFSALLLAMVANMIRKRRQSTSNQPDTATIPATFGQVWASVSVWQHVLALSIALLATTLSGLFGIGGSIFLIPIMVSIYGLPMPVAVGCGSVTAATVAGASLIGKWQAGMVDPNAALIIGVAAVIGGVVGAQLTQKVSKSTLFWMLLFIMGWALYQNTASWLF